MSELKPEDEEVVSVQQPTDEPTGNILSDSIKLKLLLTNQLMTE